MFLRVKAEIHGPFYVRFHLKDEKRDDGKLFTHNLYEGSLFLYVLFVMERPTKKVAAVFLLLELIAKPQKKKGKIKAV